MKYKNQKSKSKCFPTAYIIYGALLSLILSLAIGYPIYLERQEIHDTVANYRQVAVISTTDTPPVSGTAQIILLEEPEIEALSSQNIALYDTRRTRFESFQLYQELQGDSRYIIEFVARPNTTYKVLTDPVMTKNVPTARPYENFLEDPQQLRLNEWRENEIYRARLEQESKTPQQETIDGEPQYPLIALYPWLPWFGIGTVTVILTGLFIFVAKQKNNTQ